MLLHDYLEEFLRHLKLLNMSPFTIKLHRFGLERFLNFMDQIRITDVVQIRQSHILDYQKNRREFVNRYNKADGLRSQNQYITSIKKFMKFLKREGYIVADPSEDIEYIRLPKTLPKEALTYTEFRKLIRQIDEQTSLGYRDRTIIEVLYSSALRRNELLNLRLKDIDYEGGYCRVTGKGNKERVVPIGKVACQYLESYIKGVRLSFRNSNKSEYVFLSQKGNRIGEVALKDLIDKYAGMAGIEKHITPHTFRRSAATGMIRNNANAMLVRDMLGHDSMEAINQYIDLTIVDLKKAHKQTHPRERIT